MQFPIHFLVRTAFSCAVFFHAVFSSSGFPSICLMDSPPLPVPFPPSSICPQQFVVQHEEQSGSLLHPNQLLFLCMGSFLIIRVFFKLRKCLFHFLSHRLHKPIFRLAHPGHIGEQCIDVKKKRKTIFQLRAQLFKIAMPLRFRKHQASRFHSILAAFGRNRMYRGSIMLIIIIHGFFDIFEMLCQY